MAVPRTYEYEFNVSNFQLTSLLALPVMATRARRVTIDREHWDYRGGRFYLFGEECSLPALREQPQTVVVESMELSFNDQYNEIFMHIHAIHNSEIPW